MSFLFILFTYLFIAKTSYVWQSQMLAETVLSPDQLKWRGTIRKRGDTKIDQNFAD